MLSFLVVYFLLLDCQLVRNRSLLFKNVWINSQSLHQLKRPTVFVFGARGIAKENRYISLVLLTVKIGTKFFVAKACILTSQSSKDEWMIEDFVVRVGEKAV